MRFKYEVHLHTAEVSRCGNIKAREAVNIYKKEGYQGMVITDHFHKEYFRSLGHMNWKNKIDCYLSGYREALDEGEKLGMDIFRGIELRFTENANDYLVYGLDDDFLKTHENFYEHTFPQFYNLVKDNDQVLIYQAHPFRPGCAITNPEYLDGLEIFNGNPRHNSRNDKAWAFAEKHQMQMLSSSDFHEYGDEASGGISTKERITTPAQLIHTLKNLNCESLLAKEKICQ